MKDQVDSAKGVHCACGYFTPFGIYVQAHWNEKLVFTCAECGRKYDVLRGKATLKQGGKR